MTDRDVQDRIGEHGGAQAARRTSLLATPGPAWRVRGAIGTANGDDDSSRIHPRMRT